MKDIRIGYEMLLFSRRDLVDGADHVEACAEADASVEEQYTDDNSLTHSLPLV